MTIGIREDAPHFTYQKNLSHICIQETLSDSKQNISILNSILSSKKPIDLSKLSEVLVFLCYLTLMSIRNFRFWESKIWKLRWLFCQYSFSKQFSRPNEINGSYSRQNQDNFFKPIPSTTLNHFWRSSNNGSIRLMSHKLCDLY